MDEDEDEDEDDDDVDLLHLNIFFWRSPPISKERVIL